MNGPAPEALPRLGFILLVGVTLGWGLNWTAMKIALTEIPPWTFRVLMVPISAFILLSLARLGGLRLSVPRHQWAALIGASLFNVTGWQILIAYGITHLTSGRAAVLAFTMPVWASLLSVAFLGETMTLRRVGALALGMGGITTLLWGELEMTGGAPVGVAFMLGGALSWAAGTVMLKRVPWQVPTLSLAAWQLLVGGIPIVVIGPMIETFHLAAISPKAIGAVVFTIVWPICFCHWAFYKVVSLFPASVAAIGTLLVPVVGVCSGAVFLGEPLGWREGAALVLVSGALGMELLRPPAPPPRSETTGA